VPSAARAGPAPGEGSPYRAPVRPQTATTTPLEMERFADWTEIPGSPTPCVVLVSCEGRPNGQTKMLRQGVSALSRASPAQARAFSTVKLPDLPYDYSALAPAIAPEIMEVGSLSHARAWTKVSLRLRSAS
jgi:hypothetical protein